MEYLALFWDSWLNEAKCSGKITEQAGRLRFMEYLGSQFKKSLKPSETFSVMPVHSGKINFGEKDVNAAIHIKVLQ